MGQRPAEQVAAAVRAELARRKISGRQLAEELGWSKSSTARLLAGQQPFDVDELAAVATFLGVSLGDLVAA